MDIKFDKLQIAAINNFHFSGISKNKDMTSKHKVAVPTKETFEYILENAKKGNEMAAVQLNEWQSSCKPKSNKEKQIFGLIKSAANEILKYAV